jgi:hypothetical protein
VRVVCQKLLAACHLFEAKSVERSKKSKISIIHHHRSPINALAADFPPSTTVSSEATTTAVIQPPVTSPSPLTSSAACCPPYSLSSLGSQIKAEPSWSHHPAPLSDLCARLFCSAHPKKEELLQDVFRRRLEATMTTSNTINSVTRTPCHHPCRSLLPSPRRLTCQKRKWESGTTPSSGFIA